MEEGSAKRGHLRRLEAQRQEAPPESKEVEDETLWPEESREESGAGSGWARLKTGIYILRERRKHGFDLSVTGSFLYLCAHVSAASVSLRTNE